jgi:hypothetical protein
MRNGNSKINIKIMGERMIKRNEMKVRRKGKGRNIQRDGQGRKRRGKEAEILYCSVTMSCNLT